MLTGAGSAGQPELQAVIVKATAVEPNGTVTEAGTVNAGELLESRTVTPPKGARSFNMAYAVPVPPDAREDGVATPASIGRGQWCWLGWCLR